MKTHLGYTVAALLLAMLLSAVQLLSTFSVGIGILLYYYLIHPLIIFSISLMLGHRRGWLLTFPLVYTATFVLANMGMQVILGWQTWDWHLVGILTAFTLIPAIIGLAIGAIAHQKDSLKHPLLMPLIALSLYLIAAMTNNAYASEAAAGYLITALPLVIISVCLLTGLLDDKGWGVPLGLVFLFELLYGFMNAHFLNLYAPAYLVIGYLALLLGHFFHRQKS